MGIPIRRLLARFGPPSTDRLARLRRVLRSAVRSRRYALLLRAAGLDTPEATFRRKTVQEILARLPWTSYAEYCLAPGEFENREAPENPRPVLAYPFPPGPAIVFYDGRSALPRLSRHQTLAARPEALSAWAHRILRGEIPRPPLEHVILSLAGAWEGHLPETGRDLLWRAFRVPVFEQFLDGDGHVMAAECEAHEGLHIAPEAGIFEVRHGELFLTSLEALRHPALRLGTGFRGEIDPRVCSCGRSTPRLCNLTRAAASRTAADSQAALAEAYFPVSLR
ncbi:MAG TPA: hypothetical protein VFA33_00400 [Bryobacteraceae bacterium]|nr:hypothetical protein [Bryobacteraceae bacterium]